jgi:hypothetical protein
MSATEAARRAAEAINVLISEGVVTRQAGVIAAISLVPMPGPEREALLGALNVGRFPAGSTTS